MMSLFVKMDPKDRPTGEDCLEDPYFHGLREEYDKKIDCIVVKWAKAVAGTVDLVDNRDDDRENERYGNRYSPL